MSSTQTPRKGTVRLPTSFHQQSRSFRARGFTLVELLVVIAIIALLSSIVFAALSTAKAKSRDARRLADLFMMYKAIGVYETFASNPSYGAANTVYTSLPDTSAVCGNLGLPSLQPGWSYHCVLAATLKNTDGTGWLPINLAGTSNDAFIKTLPIDPVNNINNYYTYIPPQNGLMQVLGVSNIEAPTPTMDINSTGGLTAGAFALFSAATGATSTTYTGGSGGGGPVAYAFNPYAKVDYGVNVQPRAVAIGDLNGDGAMDIGVANYTPDNTSILTNKGDGTFNTKVDYASGLGPFATLLTDINNDNKLDLVTADHDDHTISVLTNKGDGTFNARVSYQTDTSACTARHAASGDLNGDGYNDIAVANYCNSNVAVLMNNGNGTFAARVSYPVGANPSSVAISDLNGDGKLDLVLVGYIASSNVYVLLNNGNGTFAARVTYSAGNLPISVAVNDFDSDGKPDLAVSNYGSNTISIYKNLGDGTFDTKVDYSTGTYPYIVTTGDLNGDGKPDLAVANFLSSSVSTFLNTGNGLFASKVDFAANANPLAVAIGDLNNDGHPDLVVTNHASANISVYINR